MKNMIRETRSEMRFDKYGHPIVYERVKYYYEDENDNYDYATMHNTETGMHRTSMRDILEAYAEYLQSEQW